MPEPERLQAAHAAPAAPTATMLVTATVVDRLLSLRMRAFLLREVSVAPAAGTRPEPRGMNCRAPMPVEAEWTRHNIP
ncbi:hypothetical protein Asp14428_56620 [Actinoplanes sp. NBRC 14428]|nr:hypothetical protein Asp14428_56620 [Actinoplanes sp. NBRC 14428]